MSENKSKIIPEETRVILDFIKNKWHVYEPKLESEYWKIFKDVDKFIELPDSTEGTRHFWATRGIFSVYRTREVSMKFTLIPFGKSDDWFQEPESKVWAVTLPQKEIIVINIPFSVLRYGVLDHIKIGFKYENIPLIPSKDYWYKMDEQVMPFPNPKEKMDLQELFEEVVKPKVVKMSDLTDLSNISSRTRTGAFDHTDIRCIKSCHIFHNYSKDKEHNGWKYVVSSITFGDRTTQKQNLGSGITLPENFKDYVK